jgi:hypothetical protein
LIVPKSSKGADREISANCATPLAEHLDARIIPTSPELAASILTPQPVDNWQLKRDRENFKIPL